MTHSKTEEGGHERLRRALRAFTAQASQFALRHGARKESRSDRSHEYLFTCVQCASSRLRWNAEKHTWVCWVCRATGDTLKLIELYEQTDEAGAIAYVMKGYVGGDASTAPLIPVRERIHVARRLPAIGWPSGVDLLTMSPLHHAAFQYLWEKRGIDPATAMEWKLGYGRSGWLANRIVFPVIMERTLVYWQARAMWDAPAGLNGADRRKWEEDTGYRKTLNPTARGEEATAGEVLYNFDRAMMETHVVLCEGPIDTIKVGPHAMGLLSMTASPAKLDRIRKCRATRITIYRDHASEPPIAEREREASEALAEQLSSFAAVSIALPPVGTDAGDYTREQNAAILAAAAPFGGKKLGGILNH